MSVHNKLYVQTELFVNRVDGTDLATADWAFLGTIDQDLAKADEVEFKSITYNNASFTTKIQTGATGNYTLTLPVDDGTLNQCLATDGNGVLSWATAATYDQSLNTTDNVQFVNMTLTGDLTVSGTTTLINTTNTEIKDNIVLLNNGEAGAGVGGGTGTAGLEIERGSLTNTQLLFDETTDKWTVGTTGAIGTTRYIISEIADASQTQGAIPGYDANGRLAEAEGLVAAEVTQLQNIGATTISAAQWGYLGGMDQDVITTSDVTFNDVTVTGDLSLSAGPIAETVSATITANATVASGITIADTSGGAFTLTLPTAAAASGKTYTIYLAVAGNDLTIDGDGAELIAGLSTITLDTALQHIKVTSMGTAWFIV